MFTLICFPTCKFCFSGFTVTFTFHVHFPHFLSCFDQGMRGSIDDLALMVAGAPPAQGALLANQQQNYHQPGYPQQLSQFQPQQPQFQQQQHFQQQQQFQQQQFQPQQQQFQQQQFQQQQSYADQSEETEIMWAHIWLISSKPLGSHHMVLKSQRRRILKREGAAGSSSVFIAKTWTVQKSTGLNHVLGSISHCLQKRNLFV